MFKRNLLFLFSFMLAPLAMHADPIQAYGGGSFSCSQAYPREGFGYEVRVNMYGSDGQGNYMAGQMDVGRLSGLSTCTATMPPIGFEANGASPSEGGGLVDYNGVTYGANTNGFGGCFTEDPNVRCDIVLNSSGSGNQGSIDLELSFWTLTFDDHGNIIDETPRTTVNLEGIITSFEATAGEQPGYGGVIYPYSTGNFTLGDAPEPAAWSLMLCGVPLLFVYLRRKKRTAI
jgi:hypothetical protein